MSPNWATFVQAQVAGRMVSALGRVEVQPGRQGMRSAAVKDQLLNAGDIVRTGRQSRAVILLADETQLKLNADTELELAAVRQSGGLLVRAAQAAARSDQSILNMASGEVWLRAKNTPAAVHLNTPAVTAAIRGTEFDLQVASDGESVVTVVDGSIDYRNDQGFVLVNSGEQGRARIGQAPTKVVILNPRDAVQWTLFYSGSVSARDHPFQYASAAQARAALATPPADPVRLAQTQHDAGDGAAALRTLQGANSQDAAETRGWILLEQNRVDEAMQEFQRAPARSARARLGLSLAHYRRNQFAEAYDLVRQPGDDSQLKLQRAMLDLMAGDVVSSRTLLQSVAADDPSYASAQGLLSNIYLTQNDKNGALEAAQRALQANASSPSAHLALSLAQQSFFQLPEAARSAEKALQLDPNFLQAQAQYSKLLFGMGRNKRAERIAQQALAGAPQEASLLSLLGFVLLAQGKTEEARSFFERSIQQDDTRGEPHLGLGIASMRQGKRPEALVEILTAATLEPQISVYQSYLGKAFYEERRFEQALAALKTAMDLDPRDPTPYLYSGILEDDLRQPGAAVEHFQTSIRLNDNRAVYRSRFLLDEDRATRNVSLARAYDRLGFSDQANLAAIRSALVDPANGSAHLFLAHTFLNLKGRLLAGGNELLLARLLMPVNANSFSAFNDYTTLFERPRLNWTAAGRYGNHRTYDGTLISSGGASRSAYSALLKYSGTDGWRPVNDDFRDYVAGVIVGNSLAPGGDLFLSYLHIQGEDGDHGGLSELVGESNDPTRRAFSRTNRAEVAYHHQFRPDSDLVVFFSAQQVDSVVRTFPNDPRFPVRRSARTPNLSLQAEHFHKLFKLQLKYGVDIFEGRERERVTRVFIPRLGPRVPVEGEVSVDRNDVRFRTVFVQADYAFTPNLVVTGGLTLDWANRDNIFNPLFQRAGRAVSKWDPQLGIFFNPSGSTTLRLAATRALQTQITQERLVPAHLHGFLLNQNEIPLTQNTAYNLGWDQHYHRRSFTRATAFWKKRNTPFVNPRRLTPADALTHSYGAEIVLNQFISQRLTLVPDYTFQHSEDLNLELSSSSFALRHEHEASVALFYADPRGHFLRIQQTYFNQRGRYGPSLPSRLGVFLTDASISYEMPRKVGLISLKVTNLFDRRYLFLADPLALDTRVPRRQVALSASFNF